MDVFDAEQVRQNSTEIFDKKRGNTFRQISWTFRHCGIALSLIILFRVVFYMLSLMDRSISVYVTGGVLWISMFGLMIAFPLWIVRSKGGLRKPIVKSVLKEFALAIPLVMCLCLIESVVVFVLSKMAGSQVEISSTLSGLRDAPNDVRVYLILIPMFTLGPIAEELFFRGFLYNALRQWIAPAGALVLQAFIFTLLHYRCPERSITYLSFVFVTGIVLAGVYEWRKTLWSPIALHIVINSVFVGSVIAFMILNSHTPAKTWEDAERPPEWLKSDCSGIEKMATGEEQRLYAVNTWGSQGLRLWKRELQAFQAVLQWFPDDREACASARTGIAQIYLYYLRDFRRAVVESNRILAQFKDRPEDCAEALLIRGWSYCELGNHEMSRTSFREVIESYASYEWARESALEGLNSLDKE